MPIMIAFMARSEEMMVLVLLLTSLLASPASLAAGFDCTKAHTPVEKLICADPGLSRQDEQISRLYAVRRQAVTESTARQSLQDGQVRWLRQSRNICTDMACLKKAYEARLAELSPPEPAPPVADRAAPQPLAAEPLPSFVISAQGEQSLEFSVPRFGRYAVTVSSPQGTALQLVDRVAGPSAVQGVAGQADGRWDGFLDRGR